MKQLSTIILLLTILSSCISKTNFQLNSPDGKLIAVIQVVRNKKGQNSLEVSLKNGEHIILEKTQLGLLSGDGTTLGKNIKITDSRLLEGNETWKRVWGRSKTVHNHYKQLDLVGQDQTSGRNLEFHFRLYDEGLAFRYAFPDNQNLEIEKELTSFKFAESHDVWATIYQGTVSDQENQFLPQKLNELTPSHLPLIAKINENNWIALTEADLNDWPGFHILRDSTTQNKLDIVLEKRLDDERIAVKKEGPFTSPWRVVMVSESPGKFLEYNMIHNLSEPCAIEDPSWIKPGKCAWDWWWCNRYAPEAGFKLGSNTETMKYFIDFASEMGWEYQLIDWQWYGEPFDGTEDDPWRSNPDGDILTMTDKIDIPYLVEYANSKNVKLFLWLEWEHTNKQMEEAFPLYEKWGIAGVKIDFMASEDQEVVNFYHRVAKLAAKHHLLVNFHGAYKPAGLSRTWPNLITREGVLGNEYTKWSDLITPEHKVTVPFTRGILGDMDFTPGSWVNATVENFKIEDDNPTPMSMGTRCNQLAMMVLYESALQVLCDSPHNYRKSPQGLDFLKIVPTTWDETKVLNEEMANYITVARRAGDDWYLGGMTDNDERTLNISFDFLDDKKYKLTIWKDAEDSHNFPEKLVKEEIEITKSDLMSVYLAKGGGFAMQLEPIM